MVLRDVAGALAVLLMSGCQAEAPGDAPRSEPAVEANALSPTPNVTPSPKKPQRTSQFTELDPATCRVVEESEEGPYWRRRCPGVSGYSVDWTESDLRQGLELIAADGTRTSLRLSELVGKGAFNRLGPRIEWRGETGSRPDSLAVRVLVANGSEPDAPDRSLLAIARLQPSPCLIAIVPPWPGQSEEARRIADGRLPDCMG